MKFPTRLSAVVILPLALAACTPPYLADEEGSNQRTINGAMIGGAIGGLLGLTSDKNKTKRTIAGAAAGAAIGAAIGQGLDRQAAQLREEIGDDRVQIENTGTELVVTLPDDILFDVDSDTVSAALRTDLLAVAANLNANPDSTIDVIGHTDNTGSAAYNRDLASRRAGSVASVLIDGGVAAGRITSFGKGEDEPVASNLTEEGRARNRRVEIIIRPITG